MKLVRAGVQGYKRFAAPTEMNVDGRVIAIVGPNEAGKTSFLRALTRLSDSTEFATSEWTRSGERPDSRVVWARYVLEDDDRAALEGIPGSDNARWYVVWKDPDGEIYHRVEPLSAIARDNRKRKRMVDVLVRASRHQLLRDADDDLTYLIEQLSSLSSSLDTDDESLDDDLIEEMSGVAENFAELELPSIAPKYLQELPAQLELLVAHESELSPRDVALRRLSERRPRFLMFSDSDRDLRSDYELTEEADDPPAALANLAALADINLRSLRTAAEEEDYPRVEHIIEQANTRLRHAFREAWKQSGVFVRLGTDETVLRIFVKATSGDGYTDVAERSEGMRAFIALLTFAALRGGSVPPVFLIDEAETHLHYDAQADLVRVFSRQQAASKIIYTTHSAGCLPQDLARVRLVAADDEETSSVRNAFWAEGPGLTPLLIGMGASLLAFTTTRRAVLVEGGADVVLLPTLLREALSREEIDFQVAPGLAEVHPRDVPELDLEAAKVAYLVDGDKGGEAIRRKLSKGGVQNSHLVVLGGDKSGLVLEDLVRRDVYVRAVNQELARSHGKKVQLATGELMGKNKPMALRRWCSRKKVAEPNRTSVGYHIVDLASEDKGVLSAEGRTALRAAYRQLADALKVVEG